MNYITRIEERLKKLEDKVFAAEVIIDAVADKVVVPPKAEAAEVKPEKKSNKKAKE